MDGWMDGWMGGWVEAKAGLRIAYSNQKFSLPFKIGYLKVEKLHYITVVQWLCAFRVFVITSNQFAKKVVKLHNFSKPS